MMYVFLGKNINHNVALIQFLDRFHLDYKLLPYSDIDDMILKFCMLHTDDCFEFLTDRWKSYRNRTDVTYSELCNKILIDVGRNIRFPLVIKDDVVYAGITNEEACSRILPSNVRSILSKTYLVKSKQLENHESHVGVANEENQNVPSKKYVRFILSRTHLTTSYRGWFVRKKVCS